MSITNKLFFKQLHKTWNDLINLFYPRLCVSCSNILYDNEEILCHQCISQLPFTGFDFSNNNPVYELLIKLIPIEYASSLFIFHQKGIVQNIIHQLKYKGIQEIGQLIAKITCNTYKQNLNFNSIDYIIPVPLHEKKLKKRGYNQLTVFGKNLENCTGIPYKEEILIRTINTKSQTKKNTEERRKNVKKAFDILNGEKYKGKHFLLIDDVITTGATTEACAHTILTKIPEAKVSILTIAIVYHF